MPDAESIYLFRHALVRDAAYGLFLPAERVELHRAAIGSFEQLFTDALATHAEELLQHARAGLAQGDTPDLRKSEYRYLKLAADFCALGWRVADELRYLEQLESHSLTPDGERTAFMVRRARYLVEGADLAAAEELADAALRVAAAAGDTEQEYSACYIRYRARYERGRVEPGELDALVSELEQSGPSEPLMQLLIEQGIAMERAGKPDRAEESFNRAVETARTVPGQVNEGDCLIERGVYFHRRGQTERGERDIESALSIARKDSNKRLELQALNRLGILQVESRRSQQARESYTTALELAHEVGARASAITISNNYANLDFYFLGNISSAEANYLESLEFFRERGDVHSLAHCNGVLGLMYVAAGEFTTARRCFETVREYASLQHDRVMQAKAAMGLAMSTGDVVELDSVVDVFADAIRQLRETPSGANLSRTWATLANSLLSRGLTHAAGEAIERAFETERVAGQAHVARIRYALTVGDPASADQPPEDNPPDSELSETMLFQFMQEARGGGLEGMKEVFSAMRKLATSFEADRYLEVRRALALAESTVRAHEAGDADLWRGIPFSALPCALAAALRNSDSEQPGLNDLLPGLSRP